MSRDRRRRGRHDPIQPVTAAALMLGVTVALCLSGCGSSTSHDAHAAAASPRTPPSHPSGTAHSGDRTQQGHTLTGSGTVGLHDDAGYTLRGSYEFQLGTSASFDPTNAPPGETDAQVSGSQIKATIHNTTPQRNVLIGDSAGGTGAVVFDLVAAFPSTSPPCEPYGFGVVANGYCLVSFAATGAAASSPQPMTLAAGESLQLPSSGPVQHETEIAESEQDAFARMSAQPSAVGISIQSGLGGIHWLPDGGCDAQSGNFATPGSDMVLAPVSGFDNICRLIGGTPVQ